MSKNEEQPEHSSAYDEAVSAFVERFAADLTEAGMQRMASRVFACLLASDSGALSSAELAERLQISPAAVSGAVRYLAQVHMVTRERVPGSRRERYRVHADVWYEALTNRDAVIGRWMSTFKAGIDALGPDTPAGHRLAETAEFFEFMRKELSSLMERWHQHRLEQRGSSAPGDGQPEG
ncbi:GbsR/MarR family transcriptional regulator [Streptomyces gobiensis]|uniref:GbsR/MarR family transcriptional regulator n=1 Tax=Streptomyces gobiensis TaxID=2875706 RepID=UPI001E5966CE|nr:MarR family transcriptional regulator [Streptomyces gobiensis]UGY92726.1 MarR family transcriptional regulator [Streptomyces gobiensis]